MLNSVNDLWNAALRGGGGVATPVNPVQTNIAAWFKYGVGITSSQWDDASGNAQHLALTGSPTIQPGGAVLFNGTNQKGKTPSFTAHPSTSYILFKQVSWVDSARVLNNATADTALPLYQGGVTPQLFMYASTASIGPVSLALGTYGVVASEVNGASSLVQLNLGAPVTGDAGAGELNSGLGVAVNAAGTGNWGNVEIKEIIVYSVAHNPTDLQSVITYLAAVGGVSLSAFLVLASGGNLLLNGGGLLTLAGI